MSGLLQELVGDRKLLIAVAAMNEAQAVLGAFGVESGGVAPWQAVALAPGVDLVITGVGKAAAAGGVASVLGARAGVYAGVLSLGIAGTLVPGGAHLLGSVALASTSIFADEGVLTPDGFETFAAAGFGPFPDGSLGLSITPAWGRALACLCPHPPAPIATLSTCSGTDEAARQVVQRTGATAEGMEGAAVALVAVRHALAFAELRVISNTTGRRAGQVWKLPEALARLGALARQIAR